MKVIIMLVLASALLLSCKDDDDANKVASKGTVRYLTLEGGFYGIEGDDRGHYLPENLDPEFREEGLRVYFEGILTDQLTSQMWGRTIALTRIEKLP